MAPESVGSEEHGVVERMIAIGRKLTRPRVASPPWVPPPVPDLIDRIDAALRDRPR